MGTQGVNGKASILVYDLRRQTEEPLVTLQGHNTTVNSVIFKLPEAMPNTSSYAAGGSTNQTTMATNENTGSHGQLKTLEQIHEEAKRKVEMRKKQKRENPNETVISDKQSVTGKPPSKSQLGPHPTTSQSILTLLKKEAPPLQPSRAQSFLQPNVDDVDMNFDGNRLAMDDLAQE